MPSLPAGLSTSELVTLALMALLIVLVGIMAWRTWLRVQIPPAELERRRRVEINRKGKLGDAELVDVQGSVIYYSYAVRGVGYTASQDIAALKHQLRSDIPVHGPIFVKYDPRNPANSIVLAEQWSGLVKRH